MNITVKGNNKVDVIKKIKLVLLDIKEKNKEYYEHGMIMELAVSIEQMVKSIRKTSNGEYLADVLFYQIPVRYNYHGLIAEQPNMSR